MTSKSASRCGDSGGSSAMSLRQHARYPDPRAVYGEIPLQRWKTRVFWGLGTKLPAMRRLLLGGIVAVHLAAAACGPHRSAPEVPTRRSVGEVDPTTVNSERFSAAVQTVLADGQPSQKRNNLLAGVVIHQLDRAAERFSRGHTERGMRALTGALFLVRAGELHSTMTQGKDDALSPAADRVAQVGNEGASLALYTLLAESVKDPAKKKEVATHLNSLTRWMADTRRRGTMRGLMSEHLKAVHRSLLQPTYPTLDNARNATETWIAKALTVDLERVPLETHEDREEALAAYRAVRSGGASLIALYLRHGDAKAALAAIEAGDAARVVPKALRLWLERAADEDDPEAWAGLYRVFASADEPERPETSIDASLAQGAAWGCAVQLYRAAPDSIRASIVLANLLLRYEMSEAAPALLTRPLKSHDSSRWIGTSLSLVMKAVVAADAAGDPGVAQRTFKAAAPILKMARGTEGVKPSPASLHYVLGAILTRAANPEAALPHLKTAAKEAPSIDVFSALAAINRQRGDAAAALKNLAQMAQLAQASADMGSLARAKTRRFEILQSLDKKAEAEAALREALNHALRARQIARPGGAASQEERTLARVLEHYGETRAAKRASARAFEAAGSNSRQLAASILDAARRALALGDVRAGRENARRAIEAQLDREDMVYVALWLMLLEQRQKVSSDGSVGEIFADMDGKSDWAGKLRSWGQGRLTDAQLTAGAQNHVEKTEAAFYVAMRRFVTGKAAIDALVPSATSTATELVEVMIARDEVRRAKHPMQLKVPDSVKLP